MKLTAQEQRPRFLIASIGLADTRLLEFLPGYEFVLSILPGAVVLRRKK